MDEAELTEFLKAPYENTRIVYKHFRPIEGVVVKGAVGESFHYRRGRTKWMPATRGGKTQCFIYDKGGRLIIIGEAICRTDESFCYREARDWARYLTLEKLKARVRDGRSQVNRSNDNERGDCVASCIS